MNIYRLGELEVDLSELARFIVKAKKHCYASDGKKEKMPDGSKRLVFAEGDFWYEDNYDGREQAPGRELVKWKREDGQRIWQMAYSGGMLLRFMRHEEIAEETFEFLKEVLMNVSPSKPFRGPKSYRRGFFAYANSFLGDVPRFSGRETIWKNLNESENEPAFRQVFDQDYNGCLIMP